MFFIFFGITISCITVLLIVNSHATPVDIGVTIEPIPVREKKEKQIL